MAPSITVSKGDFSFLIAFAKQLDRALEMCYDGSAPDFLQDAVGVLANGLEGLAGSPVEGADDGGGDDEGSDDDDDSPPWVEPEVASRSPRERRGVRTVGGAVGGTRPVIPNEARLVAPLHSVSGRNGAVRPTAKGRKGGKARGKKSSRKK